MEYPAGGAGGVPPGTRLKTAAYPGMMIDPPWISNHHGSNAYSGTMKMGPLVIPSALADFDSCFLPAIDHRPPATAFNWQLDSPGVNIPPGGHK